MVDAWSFILLSIPTMLILGMRHGLDVDHITAIDNLVRLHNATKKSRLVGAGFSSGHMISVLAEMIFIIYVIGSITNTNNLAFWGGAIGAIALGTIGAIHLHSLKKRGKMCSFLPGGEGEEMLVVLKGVDYVFIFKEKTSIPWLTKLKPHVHVKGRDRNRNQIVEKEDFLKKIGTKFAFAPYIKDKSSTKIIEKINKIYH